MLVRVKEPKRNKPGLFAIAEDKDRLATVVYPCQHGANMSNRLYCKYLG
jgi:hypothetical protein